jgi:hypothetical protein
MDNPQPVVVVPLPFDAVELAAPPNPDRPHPASVPLDEMEILMAFMTPDVQYTMKKLIAQIRNFLTTE